MFISPLIAELPYEDCEKIIACARDEKNLNTDIPGESNGHIKNYLQYPPLCCCSTREHAQLLGGDKESPCFIPCSTASGISFLVGIPFFPRPQDGWLGGSISLVNAWRTYILDLTKNVFGSRDEVFCEKMNAYERRLHEAGFISELEMRNNQKGLERLCGLHPDEEKVCPFCGQHMRLDDEALHYLCDACGMQGPRILSPCPHCQTIPHIVNAADDRFQVACDNCEILGPRSKNKSNAVKNWNQTVKNWNF